jgi:peptidase M42 family hydrolase
MSGDVEVPKVDVDWMLDVLDQLLRIPSPSGRTDAVMQRVGDLLDDLGLPFSLTRRGALRAVAFGDAAGPDRALVVHADTIGAMVQSLKPDGRLAISPIGTWSARFAEGGRVVVLTDDDASYTGTVLPLLASGHAFGDRVDQQGVGWDHVEVRVDEHVRSHADLAALGIQVGDFVAFDADPVVTSAGYVKSRHLDGKAGVAAALGAFKAVVESGEPLAVPAHLLVTIAEEVGQGASHGLEGDVAEMVSIDNGVVAPGQHTLERGATVAMRDETGAFDFHLTRHLLRLGDEAGIPVARDTFRHYRSDVAAAMEAGAEMRAALVAFGVDASHGHERTHVDSIKAVAELLAVYLRSDLTFPRWDATPTGPLQAFPSSAQPAPDEPETGRD